MGGSGAGRACARAALFMLYAELEDGTLCPTTMTYAVVPSLVRDRAIAREWLPRICSLPTTTRASFPPRRSAA